MKTQSILPLVVGGIIFAFSFLYFGLYFHNKKQNKRELVFALTCLCMVFYNISCAFLYNVSSDVDSILWHRLRFIAINVNALSLCWFYYYFTMSISKKVLYSMSVYIFLTGLITYGLLDYYIFKPVEVVYTTIPLPFNSVFGYYKLSVKFYIILEGIMLLLFTVYLIKAGIEFKKKQAKSVLLYFITVFIFSSVIINDFLIIHDYLNNIFLVEYGFMAIVLLISKSMIDDLLTVSNLKKELFETSEHYKYLYSTAPVGLFRTDIETGYIIQGNQQVAKIFNIDDPNDLIGKIKPVDYYPMEVRNEMLNLLKEHNEIQNFHIHAEFPNKLVKDIIVNAKIFQNLGFIEGAFTDVTDLKRIEKELNNYRNNLEKLVEKRTTEVELAYKQLKVEINDSVKKSDMLLSSEQRFKDFTNLIPEMIFECDRNGVIKYINKSALKISGYSEDDINKGLNALQFVSPEYHNLVTSNLTRMLSGEIIKANEYMGLKKDGTSIPIRIHSKAIYENGEINKILGLVIDITEQKNTEKKIIDSMIAAKSANEAKNTFLANMSHEFKTPLNSILGYCRMLEMERLGELNEKQKSYISIIKDNGNHILHLINEILDISKLQIDKMAINWSQFDVFKVIDSVLKSLLPLAEQKGITIESNIEKNIGFIKGDEKRIRQVFTNLLSNAIKFTDNDKNVGVTGIGKDEKVRIVVWDKGHGIAKENINKIFEPFVQVSLDAGVKNEGTGLGLSITKKLIELHGGTISVSSKVGSGTVFTVELPIYESSSQKPTDSP